MITEPELDGEWESGRPAKVAQDTVVREARGPRRPWWGVLVAVVATSALWAGGLYAYGDRLKEPEIRYRVTENLCDQFKAPALAGGLGGFTDSAPQKGGRHPAMDWASCSHDGDRSAPVGAFFVAAVVELHKKTDPAPEFELGSRYDRSGPGGPDQWESVPGLGQQALLSTPGGAEGVQLRVRDGGAVFIIEVMFFDRIEDGPDPQARLSARPDRETLAAAAIEDARALMAALRK
ncbi:hypothetical protein PV721_41995 [Streptomyces sp. MB09-01]|uniref:hypothetical protein n=1 Tax=Streptomyces sp. MB09-01 TaxID=3028666 RepID=UPI0029BB6555|nr:hypothetical protein [Streptomyces sp. MB09-01]MDX3540749.1 hypothetical protein [Streptomyces sp. MB09-01]